MPFGKAKPALQVEIVLHLVRFVPTGEEAGAEALHQTGHRLVDRIIVAVEAREDRVEIGLALGGFPP